MNLIKTLGMYIEDLQTKIYKFKQENDGLFILDKLYQSDNV